MTTMDNKLSCSSSSISDNLISNQLLLLQQFNNNNMSNYQNTTNKSSLNGNSQINQSNFGNNSGSQTNAVNQKIAKELSSSANSSQHGRWTKEEHQKFLEGLSKYGKNWKKVEEHIGTRSGAQIRSHAQKFFNRLEKEYGKPSNGNNMQASGQVNGSLETPNMSQQQQKQSHLNDYGTNISAEYAKKLLKIDRQQDFYEDITPMQSHLNSLPESENVQQNPLQFLSQNSLMPQNTKNQENIETQPKKKDWSKILSAQEKLKQAANSNNIAFYESNSNIMNKKEKKQILKNEKKMNQQLSQLLDQQCQNLTQNISYDNSNKELELDSGVDQEVSPSDFINQQLLNSIFEPADIESHLIQFYILKRKQNFKMRFKQNENEQKLIQLFQSENQIEQQIDKLFEIIKSKNSKSTL